MATNTDWYRCGHCGHVVHEDDCDAEHVTDAVPCGDGRAFLTTVILRCPSCSSDSLDDYRACVACVDAGIDEPREALDGCDECAECWQAADPEAYAEYQLEAARGAPAS